jgi:hypothetical protein
MLQHETASRWMKRMSGLLTGPPLEKRSRGRRREMIFLLTSAPEAGSRQHV